MKINSTLFCIFLAFNEIGQNSDSTIEFQIEQEDILAALQMAGFSIYNFSINMPDTSSHL